MKYHVTFPVNFHLFDAEDNYREVKFHHGSYTMVEETHPAGQYFENRYGKWICLEHTKIGMCYNAFVACATETPEHFRIKMDKVPETNPTKQKE